MTKAEIVQLFLVIEREISVEHEQDMSASGFMTICKDKNCKGDCGNEMHYKGIPIQKEDRI